MIIITLLLLSCSLFAANQHIQQMPSCSSSVMPVSYTTSNIFSQLHMRPTINAADLYHAYKSGPAQAETIRQWLPTYSKLLQAVTNYESIPHLHRIMNDDIDTIFQKPSKRNPLALYLQHNIHTLIACAYLQHSGLIEAFRSTQNALTVTAKAGFFTQFGCPAHSPITALVADRLMQCMGMLPEYQEESELAQFNPHLDEARAYMARELQEKGPWTPLDARTLAWFTSICAGHEQERLVTPEEYPLLAQKINALGSPKMEKLFLRTQFELSNLAPEIEHIELSDSDHAHIGTTARTYGRFLQTTGSLDPHDHILQLMVKAADHGNLQAAMEAGEIFHQRSLRATTAKEQKLLDAYAREYLNQVASQKNDPALAARATFNLVKRPQKIGEDGVKYIKSTIKGFENFLKKAGQKHPYAPLAHGYLVIHYQNLSLLEINKTLQQRYKQLGDQSRKRVIASGNCKALNFIACKDITNDLAVEPTNLTAKITRIDAMLALSTSLQAVPKDSVTNSYDLDAIIATFNPSIGFENNQHAAQAWALRAQIARMHQPLDYEVHHKCLRMAHKLDHNNLLTIDLLRKDLNQLIKSGALCQAEEMLDDLDAIHQTTRTLFWRAALEQQKENIPYALELYKRSGLPKAWFNAGEIYHHGDGATIQPNLNLARTYYEKALELEQGDPSYCLRALANIAAAEGHYDLQFKLLTQQQESTAQDAYELAKLWISGKAKEPDAEGIYNCLALACNINLEEKTLDAETANMCSVLATCFKLQFTPATPGDTQLLLTLANKNVAEAYHALACQQRNLCAQETDAQKKALHIRMQRIYLEKALAITPDCNRTKLILAKVIMPKGSWRKIDTTTASQTQKADLEKVCELYQGIVASQQPDCFMAEAHANYGDLLISTYAEHEKGQELLYKGITLGENAAYLALLHVYTQQENYTALNTLLEARPLFTFRFKNTAHEADFNKILQALNPLRTRRLQPDGAARSTDGPIHSTATHALIRIAQITKPKACWKSYATMSANEQKDFERAGVLYECVLATKERRDLFVQASQEYASMIAHVCTDYEMARERLDHAVKLGSSPAYLALLKLYHEHGKIAERDSLVPLHSTFDDFVDAEDRARFEACFGMHAAH